MINIQIFAKDIDLTDSIRVFIEEKISSLTKLFGNKSQVDAKVEIARTTHHHRSGLVFYAEVNLTVAGELIRAEAYNNDVRNAITEVKDDLKLQINKFKEKRKDLSRQPKK